MLSLTKSCVSALIGGDAATECRAGWVKDRAVQFQGSLKVNRELTYNALVPRTVGALSERPQRIGRIVDSLSGKDPLGKMVIEQALYALMNAGYVRAHGNGEQMEVTLNANRQEVADLSSGGRMEGERRPLSAYVWFRNQVWMENPRFSKDERRKERAIEVPCDGLDVSSAAIRKVIERLVLQRPPCGRILGEVHGMEEQRNELLEKAGLLNVNVKVVGVDVDKSEFVDEFWYSHCLYFLGVPGGHKCLVRVLKPVRSERERELGEQDQEWLLHERRKKFQARLQQLLDRDGVFRDRILLSATERVEIV